jgi:hypothetical protein
LDSQFSTIQGIGLLWPDFITTGDLERHAQSACSTISSLGAFSFDIQIESTVSIMYAVPGEQG